MTEAASDTGAVAPPDVAVEIIDLDKWYGDFHVLRDINLKVARGERIVICGPSGGGSRRCCAASTGSRTGSAAASSSTASS